MVSCVRMVCIFSRDLLLNPMQWIRLQDKINNLVPKFIIADGLLFVSQTSHYRKLVSSVKFDHHHWSQRYMGEFTEFFFLEFKWQNTVISILESDLWMIYLQREWDRFETLMKVICYFILVHVFSYGISMGTDLLQ